MCLITLSQGVQCLGKAHHQCGKNCSPTVVAVPSRIARATDPPMSPGIVIPLLSISGLTFLDRPSVQSMSHQRSVIAPLPIGVGTGCTWSRAAGR